MFREWPDLKDVFPLSKDVRKRKTLLEERKETLVRIRHDIRHGRGHRLRPVELSKADGFAREILDMLGQAETWLPPAAPPGQGAA